MPTFNFLTDLRLAEQLSFVAEIDKLKGILRQTLITDGTRQENSAEHSWHLALMALTLAEYADEPVDVTRVIQLLLVHDLVEIDAGDTFFFDDKAMLNKAEREEAAALRIFGLLPADQAAALRALWDEFEERITPEARFANAVDRMQPLLINYLTQGGSWRKHGTTLARVQGRVTPMIAAGSRRLAEFVEQLLADAVERGFLTSE